MDHALARAQSKGVISTPSYGWGQAEATMTKASSASPLHTTDEVDRLYHQLAECTH
jgi:hypothetical protein